MQTVGPTVDRVSKVRMSTYLLCSGLVGDVKRRPAQSSCTSYDSLGQVSAECRFYMLHENYKILLRTSVSIYVIYPTLTLCDMLIDS